MRDFSKSISSTLNHLRLERVHMTEGAWSELIKDLSRELHLESITLRRLDCGDQSYVEMLAIKHEPEDGSSPTYSSYAAHNGGATMSEFLLNLKFKTTGW